MAAANRFHSSYIKGWIKSFVCIFDFSTLHGSREGEPQVKNKWGGEGKALGRVSHVPLLSVYYKDPLTIFVLFKPTKDSSIFSFFLSGIVFFGWIFFYLVVCFKWSSVNISTFRHGH